MSDKKYYVCLILHKANNLPKADTIGKIDAYVKVNFNGKSKGQTSVVSKSYNPKWNKTFIIHTKDLEGKFELELWDKDLATSEKVGEYHFTVQQKAPPLMRAVSEWNLKSGFHAHKKSALSTLTYSLGYVKDGSFLGAELQKVHPEVVVSSKNFTLPIGKLLYGAEATDQDALLNIEYQKGRADLKVWETTNNYRDKKFIEFAYSYSGVKYSYRKRTASTPIAVGDRLVYSELKFDDVPFCSDFSKLLITVSDVTVTKRFTCEGIYRSHGWSGRLDYNQAKKTLTNVHANDKHETISMLEEDGVFVIDYDKDNIHFSWGVYEEDTAKGVVADMVYLKQTNCKERILKYFGKPRDVKRAKVGMNTQLDDLEGVVAASDIQVTLMKKENSTSISVGELVPFQGDIKK